MYCSVCPLAHRHLCTACCCQSLTLLNAHSLPTVHELANNSEYMSCLLTNTSLNSGVSTCLTTREQGHYNEYTRRDGAVPLLAPPANNAIVSSQGVTITVRDDQLYACRQNNVVNAMQQSEPCSQFDRNTIACRHRASLMGDDNILIDIVECVAGEYIVTGLCVCMQTRSTRST